MDFNLTDERRMLQETLRRFLQAKYSHETRRDLLASGKAFDQELFTELAELGVIAALFSEEDGGFGGEGFDISVVFEELGRAGVIEPFLTALLAGSLLAGGSSSTNEVRQGVLDGVMNGSTVLGFAHSEPGSRYELNQVSTQVQAIDDSLILNGTKSHVINGVKAQTLVVSARESGGICDEAGISLFMLAADAPGVSCEGHMNIDGSAGATFIFDDVRLDESDRLGECGAAYPVIEAAVARATLAVCAEAVGAMETAKLLTIDYLKERQQFGTVIGKFQALQHRMADMLIEIEQARSAVVNLAGNLDQPRAVRERHVSATKNLVGRVATLVAEESIQLHGGMGMTDEYALSYFARRLVMIDHQFGDVDYHLERFIALGAA